MLEKKQIINDGITDNSNPTSIKEIKSKDIATFSFDCYLIFDEAFEENIQGRYSFVIMDGFLSENKSLNSSSSIKEDELVKLQKIIDHYELVKLNGVHKQTAGLPPEYDACHFFVEYENGEKLSFSKDNDPYSLWAKEIFELFRDVFINADHDELKPSKEAITIKNFRIEFNIKETGYSFYITDIGKETKLVKEIRNLNDDSLITYISDIDDGLCEGLSDLMIKNHISRFHTGKMMVNSNECPHTKDGYYEIYIDLENGRQLYDFSTDKKRIIDFGKYTKGIVSFFASYMESHNKKIL